ncbi:MAG: hypothetical protein ACEPOZ_12680 [Marinifilaceae bacterium]
MWIQDELQGELIRQGADLVRFVDVSQLSDKQNQGYPNAILIGILLSPAYLREVTETVEYVEEMIRNNRVEEDEFHLKEAKTDQLADSTADFLVSKGYSAYSQSENNILSTGFFDENTKSTPLPHKTIAGLAGLGWIGKHNLLVTTKFGSAISMCTVLTDAPLKTVLHSPSQSLCGDCHICETICPVEAIKGKHWDTGISRDEIVDVYQCKTCLKCLALCPWTQKYIRNN